MARSWVIGARPECDLMVDRPTVSGRHCRLSQTDGGFSLEDLGSSNGTFVNGQRLSAGAAVPITRGDSIMLGPEVPLPWPPELAPAGARTLRIGRDADNDVVLGVPMVSGHHARIVWEGPRSEAIIEDLGSANGVALGSPDRKTARAVLSASDTIFLGTHPIAATQLLWQVDPSLAPTLSFRGRPVVIGRNSDCDQVMNVPMVSGRHARLVRSEGQTWIEDLHSANGTFVNGQRVDRSPLQRGDLVSLGTYLLVFDGEPSGAAAPERAATQVVISVPPPAVLSPPPISAPPLPAAEEAAANTWPGQFSQCCAAILRHPWRLLALVGQVPVVALLIVLLLRSGPNGSASAVAAVLFWLGLAAVWFGLSNATLGTVARAPSDKALRGTAGLAARFVILGCLGVLQCVLVWAAVAMGAGLKGPVVPMLALLVMASSVGLALGLAVVALSPRPELSWLVLPLMLIPLWLFGGQFQKLREMAPWARPVSGLVPSRWAFEGLLLLETSGGTAERPPSDLAEDYFPAETERMGVGADATALAAMLVGLAASAAFLAVSAKPAE